MSEEDKHSKSEQPTEKRLLEAGKKSPPPHSRDLTSTVTLLAAILAISWTGKNMLTTLMESSRKMLLDIGTFQVTTLTVHKLMVELIVTMGMVLGPVMLSAMMAGIAINFAQGGIVLSSEKLTLNYDRLNPLKGLKKIFNMDAGMEMLKSTLKIAVVGYMAYSVIRGQTESLTHLSDRGIVDIFDFVSKLAFKLVVNSCSILLILSFFDLLFVKWRHKQNLMMTKQEVKQEHKEADGDPKVKGKIRRIQFEQSRRRLQTVIPTADVVITNPTHFAVALRYDREKNAAPVVIAKGADHMALRIKEIAREHRVMMVENRFLARELFAKVKEGQEIPESLYAAVAEVLAYIFSLKGKI